MIESSQDLNFDSQGMIGVMRELYHSRVLRPGDYLSQSLVKLFLERCSQNRQLKYQIMPFQSVATQKVGRFFLCCVCILFLFLSIRDVAVISKFGLHECKMLRLSTKNYSDEIISDHVRFKLLLSGCDIHPDYSISISPSYMTVVYPVSIQFDGWYLETSIKKELPDLFLLEGSKDNLSWIPVGASSRSYQYIATLNPHWIFRGDQAVANAKTCEVNCTGSQRLPSSSSGCCLVGDKKRIMFDHRWTWPMLLPCVINFVVAVTFAFAAAHGWMFPFARDLMWVFKFNFLALFMTYSFFTLLWAALPDSAGSINIRQVVLPSLMAVSTGTVLALACVCREQHMPDIFLIFGLQVFLTQILELYMIYGSAITALQAALSAFVPVILFFVGIIYKLNSYINIARTRSRFSSYTEIQNRLAAGLDQLDRVERLRKQVCSCSSVAIGPNIHRLSSKTFWSDLKEQGHNALLIHHEAGLSADGSFCIDRLQAQGFLLQPFLNRKVALWVRLTNAVPGRASVQGDVEANNYPGQKRAGRSAEKFICSSASTLTRPLDMFDQCRHRIVFEDLDSLVNGFIAILQDNDVRIYDTTNTMAANVMKRPIFHSCLTLYLAIITPETVGLGIANHICELQLMLMSFESIQTETSHSLYIDYRNAHDCHNFGILQALTMTMEKKWRRLSWNKGKAALQLEKAVTVQQPRAPPLLDQPSLPAHGILGEVDGWLLEACLSICVLRGDFLTTQLSRTYVAMARACTSSALFTSTPLAAAMTKPIFKLVVFATGLLSLLACVMAIHSYNTLGYPRMP
jgi:hypothetical protein